MSNDEPEKPGTNPMKGKRAARNARAAEREREAQYAPAVQLITTELAELIELRGRISVAKTILARGGDRQAAIDALEGRS